MSEAFEGGRQLWALLQGLRQKQDSFRSPTAVRRDMRTAAEAKAAGVPYSPEYLDFLSGGGGKEPFRPGAGDTGIPPMDILQAQENAAFPVAPPVQPEAPTAPSVAAAPAPAVPPAGGSTPPQSPASEVGPELPSILDDPNAVEAVLGMGDRNRQMQYAERMRDLANPEGRYVSSGRVYTAASPLEHLGVGYARYKGRKEADRLGKEQTAAKRSIIDALRGKGTPVSTSMEGGLPDPLTRMV